MSTTRMEGKRGGGDRKTGEEAKESEEKADIDLASIQGNVNYVNVDNLFYEENYSIKLSYADYCCITEDFASNQIGKPAIPNIFR